MTDLARGALWMMGAILSFTTMAIAGREAMVGYDTFELMSYRSMVGVAIVCVGLSLTKSWGKVKTDRLNVHLLRNGAHFTGQNLWFLGISLAPLAQVITLEFTSPIWLILLAPFFLGERLTRARMVAVALAFFGVLLVARPDTATLNLGTLAAATCAVFFAITNIATKRLTKHEETASILFWLTVMQLVFGLVMAGWDGDMAPLQWAYALPLLLVGLAGLSAHYCLTTALSLAPAATIIPIDFARLPLVALLGWALYAEQVDMGLIVGGSMILVGNYINIVSSRQQVPAS
ncbi:MAG: DMT family transporter [Epibacterium sp.]|nr:DMT family transporter [Epibacterium sp.]NQX73321.1 DMT family transporter [Epibacterium sp.]